MEDFGCGRVDRASSRAFHSDSLRISSRGKTVAKALNIAICAESCEMHGMDEGDVEAEETGEARMGLNIGDEMRDGGRLGVGVPCARGDFLSFSGMASSAAGTNNDVKQEDNRSWGQQGADTGM